MRFLKYSKTCVKRSLIKAKTKLLMINGSLMKVESIAECSLGAFCNTFDLHEAMFFFRVTVLHRFYLCDVCFLCRFLFCSHLTWEERIRLLVF